MEPVQEFYNTQHNIGLLNTDTEKMGGYMTASGNKESSMRVVLCRLVIVMQCIWKFAPCHPVESLSGSCRFRGFSSTLSLSFTLLYQKRILVSLSDYIESVDKRSQFIDTYIHNNWLATRGSVAAAYLLDFFSTYATDARESTRLMPACSKRSTNMPTK